ncbi:MAG: serine--tRNA ligase, partial [Chloroflexota bacterium]
MSVGTQRLRDDADRLRAGAIAKREDPTLVDVALAADASRRELSVKVDLLRSERKTISAEVGALLAAGGAKDDAKVVAGKAASQKIADELIRLEAELAAAEAALDDALLRIPNPPDEDIPVGGAEANRPIRTWAPVGHPAIPEGGDPATPPAPEHDVVAERLGIFDLERGAKVAGAAFPAYRADGAALIRALINLFLDTHVRENGFTEIWPPILINEASARGTGQIPDKEDQMYVVGRDGFYLAPTAEVPVTNLHRDEILDGAQLPIRYAAYTPCFRREAGAAGRETRGILRLHQFDKVEMVSFERPEASRAALEWLTERAEILLQRLELPYRVLLMATGDMGFVQMRKYDLEVWAPGSKRWLEVSSCSNFGDYQARRMAIRYRSEAGAKPELVHTLNGSGLAIPRVLAALLERGAQPD